MVIVLISIILLLICFATFLYFRTTWILKSMDKMLDLAIDGNFSENDFSETRLSKLESKMRRYLSAGKTARGKIEDERNSIKSLVSDISHQTKTPIANISLYTELLSEKPLDAESQKLLKNIKNQSDKLNFLIQSLVKISRLENGIITAEPKENNIKDLLEGIDCTDAAEEKGVTLTFTDIPDITAVFDLKWTAEAISNIIDNAIKYTPTGGAVTVLATEYEMFAKIDISDTGIGMTEEETAKVFTRFYRSPRVHDDRGVGIGLYLAREILSRQGGYIKVKSEIGHGSIFSVFLPKTANLSKL